MTNDLDTLREIYVSLHGLANTLDRDSPLHRRCLALRQIAMRAIVQELNHAS